MLRQKNMNKKDRIKCPNCGEEYNGPIFVSLCSKSFVKYQTFIFLCFNCNKKFLCKAEDNFVNIGQEFKILPQRFNSHERFQMKGLFYKLYKNGIELVYGKSSKFLSDK